MAEISELVVGMAKSNPKWGYTRLRGALALLHGPGKSLTSRCRSLSHPAQYVSGIPSAVILLSISHPIRCSTRCLANVRARISGPMIAL